MALPTTRNKTYALGDPVRAADLNDLQDSVIAIHSGRRGARWRPLSLYSGRVVTGGPGVFNADGSYTTSVATEALRVTVPLEEGERIIGLRARVDPAASGTVALSLIRVTDGAQAAVGGSGVSSGAAIQTIVASAVSDVAADNAGVLYLANFAFTTAAGHIVLAAHFQVDHL